MILFRKINNDDVIPRQMVPFMDQDTLKGPKLDLYVLLKIIKNISGSKAKSFDLKYAVNQTYKGRIPEREKMGEEAIKVLNYTTIKGGSV